MTFRSLAVAGSLALLAPLADAQDAPPVPAPPAPPVQEPAPKPDGAKPGAAAKVAPLPKDRVVAVHLKNGNIVRGYALDSRLFERELRVTAAQAERGAFKAQEAYEAVKDAKVPGAGIRVWYPNNAQGFVFIAYTQIEKVDAGRVLTRAEQDALFATIRAKEARIAQAAAKLRAESAQKDAAEEALRRAMIEESIARSKGVTVDDDRKKRDALLLRFPPGEGAEGWNAARKSSIERKLTVLGIIPSADEQEFVKAYKDWAQAKSEAEQLGWKPPAATPVTPEGAGTPPAGETPAGGAGPTPGAGETPPAGEGTTPPAGEPPAPAPGSGEPPAPAPGGGSGQ
jgi:hypothetical protein